MALKQKDQLTDLIVAALYNLARTWLHGWARLHGWIGVGPALLREEDCS